MMTKGPGHGKVALYLDGKLVTTLDTNATVTTNRLYMWDFGPLTPGAHIVKLVNKATAGRPRIDLNAVALIAGHTYVPTCCVPFCC